MQRKFGRYRIVQDIGVHDGKELLVGSDQSMPVLIVLIAAGASPPTPSANIPLHRTPFVIDQGFLEGQAFFVLKFVDGQTLHTLRGAGVGRQLQYMLVDDALGALDRVHGLDEGTPRLLSGDMSPHVVFVTRAGNVELVDFAIARALGFTYDMDPLDSLRYAAPERLLGGPATRQADVYSMGVMLWEAATGQQLWSGFSADDIRRAVGDGARPPSVHHVARDVPLLLDRICERALAGNATDRYRTAAEFRADLEEFLSSELSHLKRSALLPALDPLIAQGGKSAWAQRSGSAISSLLPSVLSEKAENESEDEDGSSIHALYDDEESEMTTWGASSELSVETEQEEDAEDEQTRVHAEAAQRHADELEARSGGVPILRTATLAPPVHTTATSGEEAERSGDDEALFGLSRRLTVIVIVLASCVLLTLGLRGALMRMRTPAETRSPPAEVRRPPTERVVIIGGGDNPGSPEASPSGEDTSTSATERRSAAAVDTPNRPPDSPRTVSLEVSPSPASAQFSVDNGPLVAGTAQLNVPRDGREHIVLVVAEGYAPAYTKIVFTRDVLLRVNLERIGAAGAAPARPPPPTDSTASHPPDQRPPLKFDRDDPWRK
jgi:hypothetical protein